MVFCALARSMSSVLGMTSWNADGVAVKSSTDAVPPRISTVTTVAVARVPPSVAVTVNARVPLASLTVSCDTVIVPVVVVSPLSVALTRTSGPGTLLDP